MSLIRGEEVAVVRPVVVVDELGEPAGAGEALESVPDVVVAPGATEDLDASRPEGVSVAYTLCFPKDYQGDLKGCSVEVRGERFRVVGDPQRYTPENTPGKWNLTVEVERVDG